MQVFRGMKLVTYGFAEAQQKYGGTPLWRDMIKTSGCSDDMSNFTNSMYYVWVGYDALEPEKIHALAWACHPPVGTVTFLLSIVVTQRLRRKGLGSFMLESIEECVAPNALSLFVNHSDRHLLPFYTRRGYEPLVSSQFLGTGLQKKYSPSVA